MAAPVEHEFAGDHRSPAAARRFARSALGTLIDGPVPPELCDSVELVVSELVTNAVRAHSATVGVALAREGGRIAVRVTDLAEGWPEERHPGIHDTGGRGLALVSAVSASWGVRMAEQGKVVWAELELGTAADELLEPVGDHL